MIFGPITAYGSPSDICSPPRQETRKVTADWASLSLRRIMVATAVVCGSLLQQCRLAGSCDSLGFACSGGISSQCLWRQGMGCRSRGGLTSCTPLNTDTLFPRQIIFTLGVFQAWWNLSLLFFLFYPSSQQWFSPCICSQPHVLAFSHCQNWHSCLRQDSQEGFGMGSVQDPRDYIGGRGLALRNR